ncbi:MAG: hypothetical protein DMG81_05975 [Acidobacteria bacterium]|nr:MAG: hypothetical protein DMG81_05975 [Acidobacteriota bacterium]
MKRLQFVVSLTTDDNDYQIEQGTSAEEAARFGLDVKIIYADNDAIKQSQQLLTIIQSGEKPDAIVFEPAGSTALPQVARAAASAGVRWVILNREADYISQLRNAYGVAVFCITSDHKEIGRVQGKQIAALLPRGGSVLYIQGPSGSDAAQQRTEGMQQCKPSNVQARMLRAQWTEGSAHQAMGAWLRLSTSRTSQLDAIVAQDDSMAIGARKAVQVLNPNLQTRLHPIPVLHRASPGPGTSYTCWTRTRLRTTKLEAGIPVAISQPAVHFCAVLPHRRSSILNTGRDEETSVCGFSYHRRQRLSDRAGYIRGGGCPSVSSRLFRPVKRLIGQVDHFFQRGMLAGRFTHSNARGHLEFSGSWALGLFPAPGALAL